MNPSINLSTGIIPFSQIPLDAKAYFLDIASMQDLGSNNYKAFLYYDSLKVVCVENRKTYIWREQSNTEIGLLENGFVYPNSIVVNGIDYSNKRYNFFEYSTEKTDEFYFEGGFVYYSGNALDYNVSAIFLSYSATDTQIIAEQSFSLNPNNTNNDRIDVFVLNIVTRTVSVKEGTPAANPLSPTIDRETERLLSSIIVKANNAGPEFINIQVYDENLGSPNEWIAETSDNTKLRFDITSALWPGAIFDSGDVCASYDNNTSDTVFAKLVGPDFNFRNRYEHFIMSVALKKIPSSESRMLMYLLGDDVNGDYGYLTNGINLLDVVTADLSQTGYQNWVIPMNIFPDVNFKSILLRFADWDQQFFIDNIRLTTTNPNNNVNNSNSSNKETFGPIPNGETNFELSDVPSNVDVFVEELFYSSSRYTLNGNEVILDEAPPTGSIVTIRKYY